LFITELAFPSGALEDVAKVGVFAASVLAGGIAFAIFRAGERSAHRKETRDRVRG